MESKQKNVSTISDVKPNKKQLYSKTVDHFIWTKREDKKPRDMKNNNWGSDWEKTIYYRRQQVKDLPVSNTRH